MSIFFAVLSTIDPDQFKFVHVQTPATAFETSPLQVKWAQNEVLYLQSEHNYINDNQEFLQFLNTRVAFCA